MPTIATPTSSASGRAGLSLDPWRHDALSQVYADVREQSEALAAPLRVEDYVVQSMPDVSPTKWHLAHTTWFFETFLLGALIDDYTPVNPAYAFLFNSYYEGVGPRHTRSQRGLLSRPGVEEVYAYRHEVDRRMQDLLHSPAGTSEAVLQRTTLGLHHEQQHQELLLMDIKHVLSVNPLLPAYRSDLVVPMAAGPRPLGWTEHAGGLVEIGHAGPGFAFDNEGPRHRVFLAPFSLADRLVTNREYLAFIEDGGYRRPDLWLSDGWSTVQTEGWRAPLYWFESDGQWHQFTLGGARPADTAEPVVHLSYYEADAYARWANARLPTEAELEVAMGDRPEGRFLTEDVLHPRPAGPDDHQLFGEVWQHTSSAYAPYPGFVPLEGAMGEYNGKFMCNQQVLRGGSCLTPQGHLRSTYRNFFYPHQRWCAQGLRLAVDPSDTRSEF